MYYQIILIFIIYSLYIQFSPSIGNIWLRPDINNDIVFCPYNLFRYIIQPLVNPYFWKFNLLDLNLFFIIVIYFIIYHNFINNYVNI
jgi:hypothetical protein